MHIKGLDKYSKESIVLYASLTIIVLIIFMVIEAIALYSLNEAYKDQIVANEKYIEQLTKEK